MGRIIEFEVPAAPTLFSPLQVHPRQLLHLTMSGWNVWVREHLFSHQRLIREHNTSVVITGIHARYVEPFGFFDGEALRGETSVRVRKGGKLLETATRFTSGGRTAALVTLLLRAVLIGDPASLAATSGDIPMGLLERFLPDEIDERPLARAVAPLLTRIEETGKLLAEDFYTFTLPRDMVEFADQWMFSELPVLCARSREKMTLARAEKLPALVQGIANPIERLDAELLRPFFLYDEGTITTRAYDCDGHLAVVHHLHGTGHEAEMVRATLIEQF